MTKFQSKLTPEEKAEIDQVLKEHIYRYGSADTLNEILQNLEENGRSTPEIQKLIRKPIKQILEIEFNQESI